MFLSLHCVCLQMFFFPQHMTYPPAHQQIPLIPIISPHPIILARFVPHLAIHTPSLTSYTHPHVKFPLHSPHIVLILMHITIIALCTYRTIAHIIIIVTIIIITIIMTIIMMIWMRMRMLSTLIGFCTHFSTMIILVVLVINLWLISLMD